MLAAILQKFRAFGALIKQDMANQPANPLQPMHDLWAEIRADWPPYRDWLNEPFILKKWHLGVLALAIFLF